MENRKNCSVAAEWGVEGAVAGRRRFACRRLSTAPFVAMPGRPAAGTTAIEHPAVLAPMARLAEAGAEVIRLSLRAWHLRRRRRAGGDASITAAGLLRC